MFKLLVFAVLILSVDGDKGDKNDGKIIDWLLGIVGITSTTPPPVNKVCQPCACGIIANESRIVQGTEAKLKQYPWMVYLTYRGAFLCGASVISDRYLLTAAHAVGISRMDFLKAVFLDHDRKVKNETEVFSRRIIKIIRHKEFAFNKGFNNDIALLKLDRDLPIEQGLVKTICLPEEIGSLQLTSGTVLGWGSKEQYGLYSNKLQEAEVPIWTNEACQNTTYGNKITENMICAGYPEGGKDACKGDSGGPLQMELDGSAIVIGIVSWGSGCGDANSPGVYTRVENYLDWIKEHAKDTCFCN